MRHQATREFSAYCPSVLGICISKDGHISLYRQGKLISRLYYTEILWLYWLCLQLERPQHICSTLDTYHKAKYLLYPNHIDNFSNKSYSCPFGKYHFLSAITKAGS